MREFALILAAALGSSLLGAGFGALVGAASPEFIQTIAQPQSVRWTMAFGGALGAVVGLFLGAGAMAFALFVGVLRTRVKK